MFFNDFITFVKIIHLDVQHHKPLHHCVWACNARSMKKNKKPIEPQNTNTRCYLGLPQMYDIGTAHHYATFIYSIDEGQLQIAHLPDDFPQFFDVIYSYGAKISSHTLRSTFLKSEASLIGAVEEVYKLALEMPMHASRHSVFLLTSIKHATQKSTLFLLKLWRNPYANKVMLCCELHLIDPLFECNNITIIGTANALTKQIHQIQASESKEHHRLIPKDIMLLQLIQSGHHIRLIIKQYNMGRTSYNRWMNHQIEQFGKITIQNVARIYHCLGFL